jgi:hypothetical protein
MHIVYEKEKILVEETLSGRFLDQIERITKASAFTAIHMASARYRSLPRGVGKETPIDFQKERGRSSGGRRSTHAGGQRVISHAVVSIDVKHWHRSIKDRLPS